MNKLAFVGSQTAWLLLLIAGCDSGAPVVRAESPSTAPSATASGLDARPVNATCVAWPRPSVDSNISLSPFTSLTFSAPVALLQAPRDDSRWYVVEQGGTVKQFSG